MKSLLVYLGLVGLPLAGLAGILHAGSRLQAPASVGGTWRVASPAAPADSVIEISQSGVYLDVQHAGLRMRGELRGDSVVAAHGRTWHTPPGEPCNPALGRVLAAHVDRAAEPDRLAATLSVPGRPDCPARRIDAVRLPAPKRGGGH